MPQAGQRAEWTFLSKDLRYQLSRYVWRLQGMSQTQWPGCEDWILSSISTTAQVREHCFTSHEKLSWMRTDLRTVLRSWESWSGALDLGNRDPPDRAQIQPLFWECVRFWAEEQWQKIQVNLTSKSLCSSKKENKIFLSTLKMHEKKEKPQSSVS